MLRLLQRNVFLLQYKIAFHALLHIVLQGLSGGDFAVGDFTHADSSRYVMIVNADFRKSLPCSPRFAKAPQALHLVSPYTGQLTEFAGEKFNVQKELRKRFVEAVERGSQRPGPHVVVSHSMGTMIAYDCLMHEPDCPPIDGLMTIGSPLGLDEVQDFFPKWSLDVYVDIQNIYGFSTRFQDNIDVQRDSSGAPVEDPARPGFYLPKYIQNTYGTVLPTVGLIIEL